MDYSALPDGSENPVESSPWSTSPRISRTDLATQSSNEFHSTDDVAAGGYNGSTDQQAGRPQSEGSDVPIAGQYQPRKDSLTNPAGREGQRSFTDAQYAQSRGDATAPLQRQQTFSRSNPRSSVPQYKLQAKITGLERTGRKDLILRFDVHTNLPKFRTTQFRDVRRTHSEFIKLAEHLISSNPEAFVPAVPPPVTAAGAGTDEDEARVKALMQRWLNYVCSNEVLVRDDEMVLFVESDFGYSPVVRMKQPATGVRRKVIKQFAPPPDDTPELQSARPTVKLFYLCAMETGQKIDKVVKARRSLGLVESDLGVKLGSMSMQETHPGLATAYRKLGKIIQTTGDYHAAQGTAEATTLGDPMQYHSADAFIVKETLTNRHILLRELLQAQQTTRSRLSAADRLKASSSVKREKVDEAIAALEEARTHETYLAQRTQRVTSNLLQERRRWFARTAADVRTSIREYVLRQIESERRALATLESVRPDIRAIDGSGGLSRLGREAPPAARRASLAASQGPRGDAWSGVPRRQDGLNRSMSGSLVGVPESNEADVNGGGRPRAESRESGGRPAGVLEGLPEEDDEDRVDARNAASRLAASTF
ncbi:MAG: Ribosome-releasing factor 2, mitochondrial [Watsoniomyces obsoletus]|nr:MAG: Ribosome-releasing factor 2, mitochondrial [Watsoniomyces obsoletus]